MNIKRIIAILFVLLLAVAGVSAAKITNGRQLVEAMQRKYAGKWYKTLTFSQKTVFYGPDGTSREQTWREAMSVPGRLRIDIEPLAGGNGMLFVDGTLNSFRDGKLARSMPYVHALLVLGFDVYGQSVDATVRQLESQKIDMSVLHEEKFGGRDMYVVGAKAGDMKSPQFWIDKKQLYFVRLITPTGKDGASTEEIVFGKYVKVKRGGWVAAEVIVTVDGRKTQTEEYTDIETDVTLDPALFEKDKWSTVPKTYFKKS